MKHGLEAEQRRQSSAPQSAAVHLRLLATSDLHAHLLAWDYHANRPCMQRGLSRVATLIREARAEQPQALLFDNGDFLHGSVLGDAMTSAKAKSQSGRPLSDHPVIMAMNQLGYDAATLGNHEFGHGLVYLRRALAAAEFKLVCSNLYFKPTRAAALAQTHLLIERDLRDTSGRSHRIRIGILGFVPPQTMIWEGRYLRGRANIEDIVTSAQFWIPELRRAGADVVIALSHSGLGTADAGPGAENASAALTGLEGLDAVVAGHTHLVEPAQPISLTRGVPAVMPGFFGSHLGVIDLQLRRSIGPAASQHWHVAQSHIEARPVFRRDKGTGLVRGLVPDDPEIMRLAMPMHQRLLAQADAVVGHSDVAMNSYFALVVDNPALRIVTRAQADHVRRALAGRPEADLPLLSAAAPFKSGGRGGPENYTDVPAGPIRMRHVNDLYVHPNSLAVLRVTGAQVRLWLERSASIYGQIAPGAVDAELILPSFPSFNFDVIDGVTYRIDPSQPAMFDAFGVQTDPSARRIVDLCYLGQPVAPDMDFALCTNSYRAAGGAGFAGAALGNVIYETGTGIRDMLEEYLRAGGGLGPGGFTPGWRFVPLPGRSVLFETAPEAAGHLQQVAQFRPEPLDLLQSGFRRFRLQL